MGLTGLPRWSAPLLGAMIGAGLAVWAAPDLPWTPMALAGAGFGAFAGVVVALMDTRRGHESRGLTPGERVMLRPGEAIAFRRRKMLDIFLVCTLGPLAILMGILALSLMVGWLKPANGQVGWTIGIVISIVAMVVLGAVLVSIKGLMAGPFLVLYRDALVFSVSRWPHVHPLAALILAIPGVLLSLLGLAPEKQHVVEWETVEDVGIGGDLMERTLVLIVASEDGDSAAFQFGEGMFRMSLDDAAELVCAVWQDQVLRATLPRLNPQVSEIPDDQID